jgi:lipid-binding SYLF domain-containing protein
MVLALAGPAAAIDKLDLDARVRKITARFEELQQKPDKRVPADMLRKAQGILLLDRTKAGFIFAYQGGSGVALVKDKKSGKWGPVAFLTASEGSFGALVGGQKSFLVILFMTPEAANLLTTPSTDFGGEATGTAGDSSATVEGTVANKEKPVLVYDDRKGLYGGAAVKGGSVSPDEKANMIYYNQPLTMKEILFDKKAEPTDTAIELAQKIDGYSKK